MNVNKGETAKFFVEVTLSTTGNFELPSDEEVEDMIGADLASKMDYRGYLQKSRTQRWGLDILAVSVKGRTGEL